MRRLLTHDSDIWIFQARFGREIQARVEPLALGGIKEIPYRSPPVWALAQHETSERLHKFTGLEVHGRNLIRHGELCLGLRERVFDRHARRGLDHRWCILINSHLLCL